MKQITDSLNLQELQASSTKSQPETSQRTALPTHWITELFKVFQVRYLSKWTSQIDGIEERAVKEWSEGLAGLNGNDIKHGLDNWDNQWPPAMDEFKKCCLGIADDKWEHHSAAYKTSDTVKALPIKKAQETVVDEHREKLRKLGILKDKVNKI